MKDKEPYEWALDTIDKLKARNERLDATLTAVRTAMLVSKGDDAKAGALIRQLMMGKP